VAALDCLQSFVAVAAEGSCCRPEILDNGSPDDPAAAMISISAGRSPLLDSLLPQGAVPNDVDLRGDGLRAMVISGPNMGGKSSYMGQACSPTALIISLTDKGTHGSMHSSTARCCIAYAVHV
jgi:DNA mismatch repair protein MSH3